MNVQSALRLKSADSLARAIVVSSAAPSLLLDSAGMVIAASHSFCRVFRLASADVVDRPLDRLDVGHGVFPTFDMLLDAASTQTELKFDHDGADPIRGCFAIAAQTLDHNEPCDAHLLLTLTDVTAANAFDRRMEEMLRDQEIERRELQHRIANCLQIVASVLMHNARAASSEEAERSLRDAYNRIMSVASAQQQLALNVSGEIALLPYLRELCRTISASLVRDRQKMSIVVNADKTVISADVTVSLGLIVNELVINALKHAFPDVDATGTITVDYRSDTAGWRLSVGDTGIGLPAASSPRKGTGLGTSIIDALARKLRAEVTISCAGQGTTVAVTGGRVALSAFAAGPGSGAVASVGTGSAL